MNFLFAIDLTTEEVIVSESPKGSNKINFIERIARHENEILFNAVMTLTGITKAPNFDSALFKAMDKVCQMAYQKHKGG
jgi:protease II